MQLHSSLNSVLCEYHPALCWLPSTFTISVFICCVYSLSLIIFRSPNLLFSFFPHTCLWSGVLNEFAASLSLSLVFFVVCLYVFESWCDREWRHSRLLMLCIDLEMQLYCLTIIHFILIFFFFDRLLSSHLYRHGCLCMCVMWASKCYLNSSNC